MAACLASAGHRVRLVEKDADRRAVLRSGRTPFREPGLAERIVEAGDRIEVVRTASHADLSLICVGTPGQNSGSLDLSALELAMEEVSGALTGPGLLVIRSTIPPGTTRRLAARLMPDMPNGSALAHKPEFLREGHAIADFLEPDRVVVGTDSPEAAAVLRTLYRPFLKRPESFIHTDSNTAELAKMGANGLLASRVAIINELARLSQATGANIDDLQRIMGSDPRIGAHYLAPGPGFGGSCLPKDVRGLAELALGVGVPAPILHALSTSNRQHATWLIDQLEQAMGPLQNKRVALWGLAFKAGTDDVRNSPALALAAELVERGAEVQAYDPWAGSGASALLPVGVALKTDPWHAAQDADALVLATEWRQWRNLDASRLAAAMRGRWVLDTRFLWRRGRLTDAGLTPVLGRG
jgi:UDPglucose 6-dehydrogenase